jgi:multiple antibiotic resistance protein
LTTFLLAFTAFISIVNPLSSAFIFFSATESFDAQLRKKVARWVAIYAFAIVTFALYIGAYVLEFFGISMPALRVAGGIIIATSGWHMLNEPDVTEERRQEGPKSLPKASASRLAFYPFTMPLTTGPGTISVAISIGANRPNGYGVALAEFIVETLLAVVALALGIFVAYRHSGWLARSIGPTGTTIIVRISAFLLFCIGIQVGWNGASELLLSLPLMGHK